MANRRMFSSRVTESTRFLKMPDKSQNLYFHLGMHADDDGIVEAYPVMCTIGATEDDLRVIVSNGFATLLNEDLVTFLNDWLENNTIRADRKVDSIYKELLLQVLPETETKIAKPRYYERKKGICQTNSGQDADIWQPSGGISKVKSSKDKSINTNCASGDAPKTDKAAANEFFESLWKLYPNKKGKAQVSMAAKQRLLKVGQEEMLRAIDRYKADLEKDSSWRKPQNGSTFFNSGYVDYLDANYAEDPQQDCSGHTNRPPYESVSPDAWERFGEGDEIDGPFK